MFVVKRVMCIPGVMVLEVYYLYWLPVLEEDRNLSIMGPPALTWGRDNVEVLKQELSEKEMKGKPPKKEEIKEQM